MLPHLRSDAIADEFGFCGHGFPCRPGRAGRVFPQHIVKIPEEPGKEPEKEAIEIQSVEVTGTGRIRVILSRETERPLTLEAFSIICNSPSCFPYVS